jgi:hypothetical protein
MKSGKWFQLELRSKYAPKLLAMNIAWHASLFAAWFGGQITALTANPHLRLAHYSGLRGCSGVFGCGRGFYLVNLNRAAIHLHVTVTAISLEFSDEHNIERDAPLRLQDCFSQAASCARFPMVIKRNPRQRQRRWAGR